MADFISINRLLDNVRDQSCWRIFPKFVNLTGLKAVEHFAIVMLFLEIASVI